MENKRTYFIPIIFLLCVNIFSVYAVEIDTLKSRLESLSGQEKIAVLNELAGAYWELPPNERIVFAEQAVDLSEKFHEYKSKAAAFNHLGVAYNNLGDSPKSIDYFLQALIIMEQIDDKSGIADSYVNLGQANFYLENFDKALEYFQQSLDLRVELGDKRGLSQSLILLGNVKAKTAQYDEALDYYFKALTIKEEIDDKNGISQIYNNLGNIYFETKQPEKALECRLKSLQIDREFDNKWEIANTAFNIAEHYLDSKQPEKAYPYILESLEIAEYFDNKGLICDNLYNYSLYHELREEYQKALKYQRDYAELTKSLFSEELSEKIAEMQIKYETEKKERENQAYKLQLEKALSSRLRLMLGLLIILVIAFAIYYRYRVKKKSNLLLEGLVTDRMRELRQKINELEKAKKDLRENEQFLANIFESVQDGVSVLNLDMTIRHVNGVMKRWYAKNLPLEGKLCYQAYHNADKPCDPCPTIHCLKSGETEHEIVPGFHGSPVEFIELFSYPMKDRDSGEITGVVEFVRDITKRKQAEKELQKHRDHLKELVKERTKELEDKTAKLEKSQKSLALLLEDVNESRAELDISNKKLETSNKELEAFAYSVSHDLRAPLRHINGFAELLRSHSADQLGEKNRSYLDKIITASQNMGTLIDDLLVFSRIGRQEILKIPVKLNPMIESIKDEFKPELKDRIVSWQIDQLGTVRADPGLIKQVFVNLLSNALKFTRPRKEVKIDVGIKKSDKGEKIIYVKDNGVGFDMKYYDKLFGVFQRLHSSSDFEGTGVGLANVQRIIHRHGGKIWAESEIDKGAAFYFSLPNGEEEGKG